MIRIIFKTMVDGGTSTNALLWEGRLVLPSLTREMPHQQIYLIAKKFEPKGWFLKVKLGGRGSTRVLGKQKPYFSVKKTYFFCKKNFWSFSPESCPSWRHCPAILGKRKDRQGLEILYPQRGEEEDEQSSSVGFGVVRTCSHHHHYHRHHYHHHHDKASSPSSLS